MVPLTNFDRVEVISLEIIVGLSEKLQFDVSLKHLGEHPSSRTGDVRRC